MPSSTFFNVLAASLGFLASIFFCIGALQLRVREIVAVTESNWDYNAPLVRLWAAQRADYTAGAVLLVFAFMFQIVGAVTPTDSQPVILRPSGSAFALIAIAFLAAVGLATLVRNYLRRSVIEEVMAQHEDRTRQEEANAKAVKSQSTAT